MEKKMSNREKFITVSMIGSILTLGLYSLFIYNRYIATDPDIVNNLKFWGKSILILIPVTIVVQIIIHILFVIINKIVNREDPPPMLTDEMDKLIELKATRISHWIFILGFFLAMCALAMEMPVWVMFTFLIGSGFLAGITSDIAKLYFYKKGI